MTDTHRFDTPDCADPGVSRRAFVGAAGAGVGAALAGCISSGEGERTEASFTTADPAARVEIDTLGTLPAGLEAVAADYDAAVEEDVTFDISELGYDELHDTTFSSITAQAGGPDIATYEGRWTNQLIGTGGIVDFEEQMPPEIIDSMVDWTWEMLSDDTGDGYYGVPIDIAPVATFYNRDLFRELGIRPEDIETYEDCIEYARGLPPDVSWMAVGSGVLEWRWEMLVRQQGGQVYDPDGRLRIDTTETRRAADLVKTLYETETAIDTKEFTEPWVTGLQEGKIATVTSGAWMAGALKDTLPNMEGTWGIMRPPAVADGGGRATVHGGSNLVVPSHAGAESIARAWDFLEYVFSDEQAVMTYARAAGVFPAHEGVYDHDHWRTEQPFFGGDTYELFVDLAPEIPTMRVVEDHRELYDRMGDFFAAYLADEYDSAAAMAYDAERTLARELDRDIA